MKISKGIEGDYIQTKFPRLFFDVKGIHHPKDRIISFLRFYPNKNGDREVLGTKYKKVYDLDERFSLVKDKFPQFLFRSPELDLELQAVNKKDIEKIYSPREYYKILVEKEDLSKLELQSKDLCDLFIHKGNLPPNSIGITGSQMIGLDNQSSDIDIIVYGTNTGLLFQKSLMNIFNKIYECRMYNQEDFVKHYQWRFGGSEIDYDDYLRSEKRKLHQGLYRNIDFFIRYIKSPEDWRGTYYDYKFNNYGRIKIKAEIINSDGAIFTPCSYEIKCKKVIQSELKLNKVKYSDIIEVSSFRGRFCEQAIKGESVLVEGKLERVRYKDNEYLRILLTDQVRDKMLVLED